MEMIINLFLGFIAYHKDAFAWALHFSPNDARLRLEIGSYLLKTGDHSGLVMLHDAICKDPVFRRQVERILKSLK